MCTSTWNCPMGRPNWWRTAGVVGGLNDQPRRGAGQLRRGGDRHQAGRGRGTSRPGAELLAQDADVRLCRRQRSTPYRSHICKYPARLRA
jgi:hypothetical protein